jgi:hypothetical protein
VEEQVHDPGPPCRYEVQPACAQLPLHHECGEANPSPNEDNAQSEASEWELRERREMEEERRQEAEGPGAEVERSYRSFSPPPSFMASAEEE